MPLKGKYCILLDRLTPQRLWDILVLGRHLLTCKGMSIGPKCKNVWLGVITEILSANGYKNSASSNSYEVIHGPELTQNHSQRVKTIQLVKKLKGAMKTLVVHAHAQNKNAEIVHMCTMRDCYRKRPCT
jgi:hypothetical protein